MRETERESKLGEQGKMERQRGKEREGDVLCGRRGGEEEGEIFFFIPTSLQIAIPSHETFLKIIFFT